MYIVYSYNHYDPNYELYYYGLNLEDAVFIYEKQTNSRFDIEYFNGNYYDAYVYNIQYYFIIDSDYYNDSVSKEIIRKENIKDILK